MAAGIVQDRIEEASTHLIASADTVAWVAMAAGEALTDMAEAESYWLVLDYY